MNWFLPFPYVKTHKNDDRDAEAIAEAATRPTIRFVPVKSEVQSDIQALHRARSRLVAERTALINHLRALLLERGIVVAQGRRKLEDSLSVFADDDDPHLSPRMRLLVEDLRAEWRGLDEGVAAFDAEFVRMAREDEAARRLVDVADAEDEIFLEGEAAGIGRPDLDGDRGFRLVVETAPEATVISPEVASMAKRPPPLPVSA